MSEIIVTAKNYNFLLIFDSIDQRREIYDTFLTDKINYFLTNNIICIHSTSNLPDDIIFVPYNVKDETYRDTVGPSILSYDKDPIERPSHDIVVKFSDMKFVKLTMPENYKLISCECDRHIGGQNIFALMDKDKVVFTDDFYMMGHHTSSFLL